MKESFDSRIRTAARLLSGAEYVLIGGGAGLSAAAGLTYSGKRFTDNFGDFIARYGMSDMYTAGFYPFPTQEEKWAYWSRHILVNRFEPPALPVYTDLFGLVKDRDYFVLTTNVDGQFGKAGFSADRMFAVQGDYGQIQCARGCHDSLYDDEGLVRRMAAGQKDGRIPAALVPVCPVCGGPMEVHIRKDEYFVEDEAWHASSRRFEAFVQRADKAPAVLFELGVGFNTPTIIRFPFERLAFSRPRTRLIRVNTDCPDALKENAHKTLSFGEDIGAVLSALQQA